MSESKQRKSEHLDIVSNQDVEPSPSSFDKYRLPYFALPEISLSEVDTRVDFLGKELSFPFVISSMTGGPEKAQTINTNLAIAAEEERVALSLGSMRVLLEKPDALASFNVRKYCPSVPLLANMGMVQLNYGYGIDEVNKIMDLIDADGIFLHLNPLQEALQPEGDTNFKGLAEKLAKLVEKIERPVLVKEVGNGINKECAEMLKDAGIEWIDVSGLGGTSWPLVELKRRTDDLSDGFKYFGIPTDECLINCREIPGMKLIAGGGIRNGIHIAKSIALGATLATAAKPLLQPALNDDRNCVRVLKALRQELKITMFSSGVSNLVELKKLKLTT